MGQVLHGSATTTHAILAEYGPSAYRSTAQFEEVTGVTYPARSMGGDDNRHILETDPAAEAEYFGPKREALRIYRETMKRFDLDGFVYPPLQVPSPSEMEPFPPGLSQRRPVQRHQLAKQAGNPSGGRAGRLLSQRPALWARDRRRLLVRRSAPGFCLRL